MEKEKNDLNKSIHENISINDELVNEKCSFLNLSNDISILNIFSKCFKLIFYSLFMLNKKHSTLTEKLYNLIPDKWYFPFNTFDIMFVIAVKK